MASFARSLSSDEELHWIALALVPGLGPVRAVRLIQTLKTPQAAFQATPTELAGFGIPMSVAHSIVSGCTFDDAVLQQDKMRALGASLVPYTHPVYPEALKAVYDPPVLLFSRGNTDLLASPTLGVVGTRRATPYGLAATKKLASDLALAGMTIASGMARGIDTAAHKAALGVGGHTLAVFGSGLDHIYPSENRRLAETIAEKGLILSEYPMSTPAHPQNFPQRNRIISGMSAGVLIVEGAQYSGSAITARLAMDQGREVFAVPGPITARMSWGPNLLVKQGAKLVQDAEDILSDLPPEMRRRLLASLPPPETDPEPKAQINLDLRFSERAAVARSILDLLKIEEATQLDQLLDQLESCSSSETIPILFELELAGLVRQLPGKNFVKVW